MKSTEPTPSTTPAQPKERVPAPLVKLDLPPRPAPHLADSIREAHREALNLRAFGPRADGITDDAPALVAAVRALGDAGGAIFIPPGVYALSSVHLPSHVSLLGHAGWSYRHNGSTTLIPSSDEQHCILDLTGSVGVRIKGLTLDGRLRGRETHGIFSRHAGVEQHLCFEDLRVVQCSGSGIRLDRVWVFSVRGCLLMSNRLDGLDASASYDGWVIDNQLADNGRAGLRGQGLASVTLTANRVEWNRRAGLLLGKDYVDCLQISNCFFDRNFGPGIELIGGSRCTSVTVISSLFRNNGYQVPPTDRDRNCHAIFRNVRGLVFSGNSLRGGTDDSGTESPSPSYGLITDSLTDSVVTSNSLYHAAINNPFLDLGNHHQLQSTLNPASPQTPSGIECR